MPSLSVKFSSMAAVNPVKNRGQKAVPTATKKTMMKKGTAVAKTTRAARGIQDIRYATKNIHFKRYYVGAKTKTSKRAMKGVKAVLKKKGGPNENATRKTDQPSLDFEMDKVNHIFFLSILIRIDEIRFSVLVQGW